MKAKLQPLLDLLKPPKPIASGVYAYQSPPDAPAAQKMYLRVEPNGLSTLVINASLILHLNHVATEFAYAMIHHLDEEQTIRRVVSKYRVDLKTVRQDYHAFLEKLNALSEAQDLDPIEFFGFERASKIDLESLSAPYRLDCALTYRLPENAPAIYAPLERVKRELSTSEWKTIIDKAWAAAIPHIIFTGGEPTLRPDLLDLIDHTEQNGQICGLITDGHIFLDDQVLDNFLNTGLDHLMLLLDPRNPESWPIIEKVTPLDIFTAVHITIDQENAPEITDIIPRLAALGINALSLSAISVELSADLTQASELAAYYGIKQIWDLPVPYSKFNPVRLELVDEERLEGGGKTWLYIEPDGDVLPAQGVHVALGNLLTQPWEEIWGNCQDHVKRQTAL